MADFGLTIKVTEGSNDGPPIPGAIITAETMVTQTDVNGNAVVDGLYLTVEHPDYAPYVAQPYHRPSLQAPVTVSLQKLPPVPPLPPVPSRDTVCSVRLTYQGLTVSLGDYPYPGGLPWFEAALTSLSKPDREVVYFDKRAAYDRHCIVALTWNYDEPGQPYGNMNQVPGCDLTQDLPKFASIVREVIVAGFTPILVLGGDGQSYSAAGGTYGAEWLIENLPRIVEGIGELAPYCIFCPGFDGVF